MNVAIGVATGGAVGEAVSARMSVGPASSVRLPGVDSVDREIARPFRSARRRERRPDHAHVAKQPRDQQRAADGDSPTEWRVHGTTSQVPPHAFKHAAAQRALDPAERRLGKNANCKQRHDDHRPSLQGQERRGQDQHRPVPQVGAVGALPEPAKWPASRARALASQLVDEPSPG